MCAALALSLTVRQIPPAWADTPSAEGVAAARRDNARAEFEAGVKAFSEERFADAVQAFQRADAIEPSAPLSFNIARAFERLNDTSSALRWYRDYLRRSPQASNAASVRARVAELASVLSKRGVQQVTVLSTPAGANVTLDRRVVGRTPLTLELAPGAHHLELRLDGRADARVDFTLEPGVPQDLALELAPATTARNGGAPATRAVPKDARTSASPQRPYGVAPWVVGGAGAATLLAALGFELARRSAESAAEDGTQLEYPAHYDSMHGRQTAARVLAGVGGALLVTGGVLFVLSQSRQSHSQVAVGCAGDGCGLAARGRF